MRALNNALNENARRVDEVWIKLSDWLHFLNFSDGHTTRCSHVVIKVQSRGVVDEIALRIAFIRLYDRQVRYEARLKEIFI